MISRSVLVTILRDGLIEKLTLHVGEKVRASARNDSTLWRMTPHCGEWLHIMENDSTLWRMTPHYGEWLHIVENDSTLWRMTPHYGEWLHIVECGKMTPNVENSTFIESGPHFAFDPYFPKIIVSPKMEFGIFPDCNRAWMADREFCIFSRVFLVSCFFYVS